MSVPKARSLELPQEPEVSRVSELESPIERATALIGDRYSLLIVHYLHQFECLRFIELEEQISGISPRTLTMRLKQLAQMGLVDRRQYATIPPKVEYRLTETAKDLVPILDGLCKWANAHFPHQPKTHVLEIS